LAADDTDKACWERNFSAEAAAYTGVTVATTSDTGDWDTFSTAATNWDTAFKVLVDARAELDIAVYYYT
jgi:hypothetical protein